MDEIIIVESNNTQVEEYTPGRSRRGHTEKAIINAWLDAVSTRRSGSQRTHEIYKDIINKFKDFLAGYNLPLIPLYEDQDSEDYLAEVSEAAQIFVKRRSPATQYSDDHVSNSTIKQRSAVLSSFYKYAVKKRHIKVGNPIDLLDRPTIKEYSGAAPLEEEDIARVITAMIEQITKVDPATHRRQAANLRRNLALIVILLSTGRRARAVLSLRRKHIKVNKNKTIQLFFEHEKNNKKFKDILSPEASAIVVGWLQFWYGGKFFQLGAETPLWVDLSHSDEKPLEYPGLRHVVYKLLGTSKVHATRHTFAHIMLKVGANVSDIQKMLGHESLATTAIYLESLKDPEANPYSADLDKIIGITKKS